MAQIGEIQVDEVDGVRVLWRDLDGPFHAHLTFGVGQAHETLPLHGVTHLVEHLVLSGSGQAPHAYNGSTGSVSTSFVVTGSTDDVVNHLGLVCANLRALPVQRFEHECQVLRAEAAQRAGNPADPLLVWRWGPVGFGIPAYEEMALRWVGSAELVDWSTRFAQDNAVLWLSKPPPAGLALDLAASATPRAEPALHSQSSPLPAAFPLGQRGVSFSILGARGPESSSAMWLLQHRLEQRLRHELGLVYGVTGGTDVLDGDTRHFMFRIDCLEENSGRVQDEVTAILGQMQTGATDAEWDRLVSQRALFQQVPVDLRMLQFLDNVAQSFLLGREVVSLEGWEKGVLQVEREEVSTYLAEAMRTLVIGVEEPTRMPAALAQPLPLFSEGRVSGAVLQPSAAHPDARVNTAVVGKEGASLVFLNGDVVSVRSDKVAGVLCFDDGTRHLLGTDGFHVKIAPEEWQGSGPALKALDLALTSEVRIAAGAREASPVQQSRLRPKDLWATLRLGSWKGRWQVLTLLLWFAVTLVLAATGNPVPLALGLVVWAYMRYRERARVNAGRHSRLSDGGS